MIGWRRTGAQTVGSRRTGRQVIGRPGRERLCLRAARTPGRHRAEESKAAEPVLELILARGVWRNRSANSRVGFLHTMGLGILRRSSARTGRHHEVQKTRYDQNSTRLHRGRCFRNADASTPPEYWAFFLRICAFCGIPRQQSCQGFRDLNKNVRIGTERLPSVGTSLSSCNRILRLTSDKNVSFKKTQVRSCRGSSRQFLKVSHAAGSPVSIPRLNQVTR
jgi:hypothetical protein